MPSYEEGMHIEDAEEEEEEEASDLCEEGECCWNLGSLLSFFNLVSILSGYIVNVNVLPHKQEVMVKRHH